jgi:hypothetical protein
VNLEGSPHNAFSVRLVCFCEINFPCQNQCVLATLKSRHLRNFYSAL